MTTTLLREAGVALYGPRWRAEMARALGVAERTVWRWDRGQFSVPVGVWNELRGLLAERGVQVQELERRIDQEAS